ncbi:MAG: hypothetical protein E6K76_02935 [Candidatus Eisenbacteria bacterium]|uniref:Glucose-6-phosphate dehydrogenase assembly protein OpcA n=1 Tax=Eiseniibacteriota bacterium TaxID=2212470 RepID=A0A538T8Z4_UNCEI|nr:MAG: hypothetical protein E6K76_02935 [Candidatus Eisenbacteria bacterium]
MTGPSAPASDRFETHLLDAPDGSRPFDATAIESGLRTMWKRAGESAPSQAGAIYRAALSNLVVPLDPRLESKLMPVLVDVTRRHPSRLFSIGAGSAPRGAGIRARIGALCHRREGGGGGLVCCEQVIVQSDPASTPLIPSAIRSLLIGDLPTVLLDFNPDQDLPWVSELMDLADLILEDSCLKEPGRERDVWNLIERKGSGKVHDLAWARLTPWRQVLAEVFDTKEYLPALGTVRRVEIGFAGSGFPPPPAWLLAGWLASRLSWAPAGASSKGLVFRSGSGDVLVAMTGDRRGEGRALERIRIQAEEPHPLDLEFTHQGREATATIVTRAPRARRTEVPFDYREFAACIVGEIHRHTSNRSLEGASRLAERLMKEWKVE